jgi:uncharacterized membrane protein YeaQ/YmgE (transglycosylase-associated protein family)
MILHILGTIVIGFIVGLIARALHPGRDKMGFLMTVALGIGGSFLAKFLGQSIGLYRPNQSAGFVASVIGAILLLVIYGFVKGRSAD